MRRLPVLLLALAACSSSLNPDLFVIEVPSGQPCTGVLEPPIVEERQHVDSELAFNHNTDPPTSGTHFGQTGPTGIFDEPIPDGNLVHNLEHGHIVIHHDGIDDDALERIAAAVTADPTSIVVAPRPGSSWAFSMSAWGRVQVCVEVPEDVDELIGAFVRAHRGSDLAPEGFLA